MNETPAHPKTRLKPPPIPNRGKLSWVSLAGVLVSMALFGLSLTMSGYATNDPEDPRNWTPCWGLLPLGWLGIFDGFLAWFANPCIFLAWAFWFAKKRWVTFFLSLASLGLALSFLARKDIMVNEAGGRGDITGHGMGYWIWITSMAAMTLWALGEILVRLKGARPSDLGEPSANPNS